MSANPPLFQSLWNGSGNPAVPGTEITLRDLFAALFTLGMHSSYAAGTLSLPTAADLAYKQADALLAAREKRT